MDDYGKLGENFFFCSLYSATANVFIVRHFRGLSRADFAPPGDVEGKPPARGGQDGLGLGQL